MEKKIRFRYIFKVFIVIVLINSICLTDCLGFTGNGFTSKVTTAAGLEDMDIISTYAPLLRLYQKVNVDLKKVIDSRNNGQEDTVNGTIEEIFNANYKAAYDSSVSNSLGDDTSYHFYSNVYENYDGIEMSFYLTDIDGNGVKELIINGVGGISLYTIKNGSVVALCQSTYSSFWNTEEDGYFYHSYEGGSESEKYSYKNGELSLVETVSYLSNVHFNMSYNYTRYLKNVNLLDVRLSQSKVVIRTEEENENIKLYQGICSWYDDMCNKSALTKTENSAAYDKYYNEYKKLGVEELDDIFRGNTKSYISSVIADKCTDNNNHYDYLLVDIDGNGILEFVVVNERCFYSNNYEIELYSYLEAIYSVENGKVVPIVQRPVSLDMQYISLKNTGEIICGSGGDAGGHKAKKFAYEDGKLVLSEYLGIYIVDDDYSDIHYYYNTDGTEKYNYLNDVDIKEYSEIEDGWDAIPEFDYYSSKRYELDVPVINADITTFSYVNESSDHSVEYKPNNGYTTKIGFSWNDDMLTKSSTSYDKDLALFAAKMSLFTYSVKKDKTTLNDALNAMGVKDENIKSYPRKGEFAQGKEYDGKEGVSPCVIANKTTTINGQKTDVYYVFIRGTYKKEWVDNFEISTEKTHMGFERAANYVKSLLDVQITSTHTTNRIKVFITGHSRGGAVTNLVAKKCDDSYPTTYAQYMEKDDIFAYGFAVPNVSQDANSGNKETYNNIYSIVNPEDFVTKLVPSGWGYGRYGYTYVLPSKTAGKTVDGKMSFNEFYEKKCAKFKSYRNRDFSAYPMGMLDVSTYIKLVTSVVWNQKKYYKQPLGIAFGSFMPLPTDSSATLYTLYKGVLGYNQSGDSDLEKTSYLNIVSATQGRWGIVGLSTIGFLITGQVIEPKFECSHLAENYLASMEVVNENNINIQNQGKMVLYIVNCPVDVEVNDGAGNTVGKITNNVVDTSISDSITMGVQGDSKRFFVPVDGDYSVKLTGNADGNMDCSVCEYDLDAGETSRAYYHNLQLSNGKTY
ncbi:MAG: DUF2974 domain-containing protein, partial [Lachnospiraceae bacterium]|nr:DUF2974 domain-containing protein [Lachnospiraceae bacterium]